MSGSRPLEKHVALVTGASSGLGRATAIALARAGADIALLARSAEELEQAARDVSGSGCRGVPVPVDLADAAAVLGAVEGVIGELGRVDVLVNAAATDVPGEVEQLAQEDWDRVIAVNLRALFLLAKAVFPHMRQAARGTIVNVSSVAGKRGWANAAAYCASKFALTGFTQALAAEGKPHGIRACVVYPGAMHTRWGAWTPEERRADERAAQAPGSALPPDDVADLIVWIASAPPHVVLNEAVVSPLLERGWP